MSEDRSEDRSAFKIKTAIDNAWRGVSHELDLRNAGLSRGAGPREPNPRNLSGADLRSATLFLAHLDGAILSRTNLASANPVIANLIGANLAPRVIGGCESCACSAAGSNRKWL
jgi:hypothetical protein